MPCPPGDSGISPGPGGPKAGALMAVVRESVTAGGAGAGGPHSRAGCSARGHLCQDVAVLLVSELSGNSVQQSRSADPGEAVTLAVRVWDGMVRVEVLDGGPRAPELQWPVVTRREARGL
jgi:hypothetical protein